MTKGTFIELVSLRIHGGNVNADNAVWLEDIEAYVPVAVNYAVTKQYYLQKNDEGDREGNANFYGYYGPLELKTDPSRKKRRYITLPKKYVSLPRNRGIRSVEDSCGNTLIPMSDSAYNNRKFYEELLPGEGMYRPNGTLDIDIFNVDPLAGSFFVIALTAPEDLEMDDELPIPAGLEADAIDLAVSHFSGERQSPADRKNDSRDVN